jgi:uncharacterized protein YbjQ (UPF0145 family)
MASSTLLVVTTDTIPGKKITKTLGMVQARNNPLVGALFAASNAQKNLEKEATKLGANAIIGLQTQRQQNGRNIVYYLSGTAVFVED